MTNPTTNFGWQMPTNTDLVTDLPADFEVFGQAVDTTLADLKGGTSGQILSKASATDMDFTWITNDIGDITAVNVTSPVTGGGTSGAVTIGVSAASTAASGVVQLSDSTSTTSSVLASTPTATKAAYDLANTANTTAGAAQTTANSATTTANAAIPKSTVTTAGDVIYATGSSAVTRLGVGSTGQVLTVAGGLPSWATPSSGGGMTLLSTTTLTGSAVTISSISQSYKNLYVQITGATFSSAGNCTLKINSVTDSFWVSGIVSDTTTPTVSVFGGNTALNIFKDTQTGASGHVMTFTISNYADSTYHTIQGAYTTVAAAFRAGYYGGGWSPIAGGAAVTQLVISTTAGTFNAGTVKIYGVS